MKKIISLVVAAALLFTLGITAYAIYNWRLQDLVLQSGNADDTEMNESQSFYPLPKDVDVISLQGYADSPEYQAMLAAIEANKQKIGDVEEKTLLLFDELEAARINARKTKENNDNTIKNIKSEFDELYAFSKDVEKEIARLKEERPKRLCGIDPDTMAHYTRLLNSKNCKAPVSKVEEGICGNCHLRVTPQCMSDLKRDSMAVCDNCQGLLYAENMEE